MSADLRDDDPVPGEQHFEVSVTVVLVGDDLDGARRWVEDVLRSEPDFIEVRASAARAVRPR